MLNLLLQAQAIEAVTSPYVVHKTGPFVLIVLGCVVLFVLVMGLLHLLPPLGKKWLMIVTTFVAGLFYLVEYLWPVGILTKGEMKGEIGNWLTFWVNETLSNWVVSVTIWTFGLGLISLALVHGRRLLRRQVGWHNSLAFFLAMIAIIVAGLMSRTGSYAQIYMREHGGSLNGADAVALKAGVVFDWLFSGLLVNLDAAMFSLLAFYIASAAYRAFRVRTVEAALLMVAALVVMLGLVNFGVMLTSGIDPSSPWAFFRIERLSSWILSVWNMPAQRAVTIGVAVGALAMALRLWLSLERGAFFSQER